MKPFIILCLGASIGIAATFFIMSDQCAYHVSNACNERDRYIDSLAKCNGTLKDHICYPPYKNN